MNSPLFAGSNRASRHSAVLIVVLAILVFLSFIIIGLTLALQTESQAAHYYAARGSADMLAQSGVEYARAALVTAEQPTNVWVTAPGYIYYWPTNSTLASAVAMSLSSGATNAAATGIYAPPDLNRQVFSEDSLTAITGANASQPMNVGWIYVHQSGMQETNQVPAINAADPIIGRFAYWTDDESSRVDLNTAYATAGNTNSLNHPSRIDLTSLFGLNYAQEIYTNALIAFFNSPDDARRLDPNLSSMISTNRFSLTHYAYSQNLNPWGLPKILLTTQQKVAGTGNTNFLNILTTANSDPGTPPTSGSSESAYEANLGAQINLISGYLTNNWPGYGTSFATKYGKVRVQQLALDIIDYVRSEESSNLVVFPDRGQMVGSVFNNTTADPGDESGQILYGVTRHPLITEVGMWETPNKIYTNAAGTALYRVYAQVEIYLPPNYGTSSFPVGEPPAAPATNQIIVQGSGGSLVPTTNIFQSTYVLPSADTDNAEVESGSDPLTPGTYCVVSATFPSGNYYPSFSGGASTFALRIQIYNSGQGFETVPGYLTGTTLVVPVNTADPVTTASPIMEVNDPRVNKVATDWVQVTDKIGGQPKPWMTSVATAPPQDTDSSGTTISGASLYMPPPKGSSFTQPNGVVFTNSGTVQSLAELGCITTGVECSTNGGGIPWRSVRLQPTPVAERISPPDWALLDLFEAPYASTNRPDLYQPVTNAGTALVSMAGLVNLNSSLTPFTNNLNVTRTAPLVSLFQNAPTNQVSPLTNLVPTYAATNVGSMTMAANGTNYGIPAFVSPGELAEIQGISDGGEATESNLKGLVDLSTVRGSTLRVYSLGQSLQQTPAGALVLQSEQYREAIVAQDTVTHHVTVFWKNISQ